MSFNWAIAWVNRISVIPGVSDPARLMSIKLSILLNFRENVSWKSTGNHTCWSVRHPANAVVTCDIKSLCPHADGHATDISFTVCLFLYLFLSSFVHKFFVTDVCSVGWCRAMKCSRMVDIRGWVESHLLFWWTLAKRFVWPRGQKMQNVSNAYLVDRL